MPQPQPSTFHALPGARHVERLGGEALVYDVASDHVIHLAADATAVWDACTTATSAAAIASTTGLPVAKVDQALAELVDSGLVEATAPTGIDRRQFGRKVGVAAAALAGMSLVTAIAAPTPAMAASGTGGGGPGGGGGQSGGGDDCTTNCG